MADYATLIQVLRRYGFAHRTTPHEARYEVLIWQVPDGGDA